VLIEGVVIHALPNDGHRTSYMHHIISWHNMIDVFAYVVGVDCVIIKHYKRHFSSVSHAFIIPRLQSNIIYALQASYRHDGAHLASLSLLSYQEESQSIEIDARSIDHITLPLYL
jgi:hypothetical protein